LAVKWRPVPEEAQFHVRKRRLGLFQLPKITKSRSALKYRSSIRFEIAVSTVCSYTKWSFSLSDITEPNRSPVNGGDDSRGGLQLCVNRPQRSQLKKIQIL